MRRGAFFSAAEPFCRYAISEAAISVMRSIGFIAYLNICNVGRCAKWAQGKHVVSRDKHGDPGPRCLTHGAIRRLCNVSGCGDRNAPDPTEAVPIREGEVEGVLIITASVMSGALLCGKFAAHTNVLRRDKHGIPGPRCNMDMCGTNITFPTLPHCNIHQRTHPGMHKRRKIQ